MVTKEFKVDAVGFGSTLQAAQNIAIEMPRLLQIIHRE
jgi:hypothetical protein